MNHQGGPVPALESEIIFHTMIQPIGDKWPEK